MSDNKYILVYGSLRKGQYNFERFEIMYPDEIKYIKTTKIQGYDLYSLGSYPGIILSNNKEQELVVDILEVSDQVYRDICIMEHGAGYSSLSVTIDDKDCTLFLINIKPHISKLVISGDWSEYLQENAKLR